MTDPRARRAASSTPRARAVLDVGALHARAIAMDARGKVLGYKMTSQCASGSGQFLENIAPLSRRDAGGDRAALAAAEKPEAVSSICAVLAETDVINMVSRGLGAADILRGIHDSMAGRFARLLQSLGVEGVVFVSGGLAADDGLRAALDGARSRRARREGAAPLEVARAPAFGLRRRDRRRALGRVSTRRDSEWRGAAWTANATA